MKRSPRDHAKLICDIGELSGLFKDTANLEAFLQKIVGMISEHMGCEVCSIYLFYEDAAELVLKATKGLNPDSIGKVKLKIGEGLTGLALKELRHICERKASSNPNFKHFPGIGEENYESFLAIPILRGNTRIGVMVIQNAQSDYFTEEDIKVLRAITSQLANTIETAKLLMSLNERKQSAQELNGAPELKFIQGRVGSEGVSLAEAVVLDYEKSRALFFQSKSDTRCTLPDFFQAVRTTELQLEGLQKQIEEKLSDVASLIFTAQILMLKDRAFIDGIVKLIHQGQDPAEAIRSVIKKYVDRFNQIPNAYLREKSHDVEDIGQRLLRNLIGAAEITNEYSGCIIIAKELFPSDILKLSSQGVQGIILLSGGVSSHLAILARSLLIPLVIADRKELLNLPPKTKILLDAETGNIYINPSDKILAPFEDREEARIKLKNIKHAPAVPTKTKDGTKITILSNINLFSDLKVARELHAEGIGLYRTEFPFIVRSDFPSEEEQFVIYKRLVDGMAGKEITFRTLDIGGDKVLSYYNFEKEENPFLGIRSIRFSLRHKDIFTQQIRAILRAGVGADIRIMFPMISSLDEFCEAREIVFACMQTMEKEKIAYQKNVSIGMMVELPSVLEIIDELAEEADFFCIGTNDFIQYMLAVDRTNEKVADFYLAHHPAVLRAIRRIVEAAAACKKDVSICGDMIQDEKYIPFFLGIGIRKISLDCRYLPKIRDTIAGVDLNKAKKHAEMILSKNRLNDIAKLLDKGVG